MTTDHARAAAEEMLHAGSITLDEGSEIIARHIEQATAGLREENERLWKELHKCQSKLDHYQDRLESEA